MNIEILAHTPQPVELIYRAFKQCYAKGTAGQVIIPNYKEMEEFICKWMDKEHESPLEHVYFTFSITGTSRVNQQQLTRHRHASFNIQSQRYVDAENFEFVIPKLDYIKDNENKEVIEEMLNEKFKIDFEIYNELVEHGVKKEDARYMLPLATTGNMVMTMNLRELRHLWRERLCIHAQWEIREMAQLIKEKVEEIIPFASRNCMKCNTCRECKNREEK